jgi:hypothetical protein
MTWMPKKHFLTNDLKTLPLSERNKSCERRRTKYKKRTKGDAFTKTTISTLRNFFNMHINGYENHVSQPQIGKIKG